MRKIAITLTAAMAVLAAPALQARPKLTPEQELAKLLEGREAGKPSHCISQFDSRDMRVIDKTAIVYGWGDTIWVNRPQNAKDLDDDDILVTRTTGSQLCDLDIVHTVDRAGHFTTGFVSLGQFVPYKRTAKVN